MITETPDSFRTLAAFLKTGKTANQIAAAYKLGGTVQAKRLVKAATKAGIGIEVVKGKKPPGAVGRRPNVYTAVSVRGTDNVIWWMSAG